MKFRWVQSEEESTIQSQVQSSQQQFRSKELKPVVRQGQQFTQVNLKLKGNFIGKSNATKQGKVSNQPQTLAASSSGHQLVLSPKLQGN